MIKMVEMIKAKIGFLGGFLLACTPPVGWTGDDRSAETDDRVVETTSLPQVPEAREIGEAFAGVAERVAPSVVRVTTKQPQPSQASLPDPHVNPFEGTPFERFFEDFRVVPPESPGPRMGMGSGVVIDEHGHILTNHHVVAHADEVRVTFMDGKELPGKLMGTDPVTDLAVLEVEGATAKPAEFGDSEAMHVGEWVIAIGNPFGLDHSVTVGVLSAKGRHGFAPGKLEDFLQTDASINPGNSGGPLVDLRGQIIGINTMIAGLGTGIGFAVSESIAQPIVRQLIEHGKVTRPYLGIVMQALSPELRRTMGEQVPEKGALVAQVQKGSPAETSGVQVGDVVVRVDGKPTEDARDVQRAVLERKIGEMASITVWRNGDELDIGVRTEERPTEPSAPMRERSTQRQSKLGLGLQTLTPDLSDRLGLERTSKGVVVVDVRPGSLAAEAGLRERDVLINIDRTPVATAQEAVNLLSKKRAGGHLAYVQRGDTTSFIVVPHPDNSTEGS